MIKYFKRWYIQRLFSRGDAEGNAMTVLFLTNDRTFSMRIGRHTRESTFVSLCMRQYYKANQPFGIRIEGSFRKVDWFDCPYDMAEGYIRRWYSERIVRAQKDYRIYVAQPDRVRK